MHLNGHYFRATVDALNLDAPQRADAVQNASCILEAVIRAYGAHSGGMIDPTRIPNRPVMGLVYGRIQSGKTRAMISTTALAFDNGFRISIVMTSNINDLVSQTHIDFSRGLPGLMTFTKDNDLDREVANTRLHLGRGNGRLLLICSKGTSSLRNISKFLNDIGAAPYPAIIFDDEGDQASLDTNTRRRSTGVAVAPSPVNEIIQRGLRTAVPRHVYVSVTGTPQAVVLQSADSSHRPSFIEMLPPGASYVGGDQFFSGDDPEDNESLIALVDPGEQAQLLDQSMPIPRGLRNSLLFFLVSASAAIKNIGVPERGYSFLCHPSLKNDEQAIAEERINTFLTEALSALLGQGCQDILSDLRAAHAILRTTLRSQTPTMRAILETLRQFLPSRRLLVINAREKRQGINYGRGLNFLIGGNTLGRGIAIRDLLVTYYVRDAKVSQIDTMHQHARMYGYRTDTLPYTRLYIPRRLYYRFRDICRSDTDLRAFIERHRAQLPGAFPVEFTFNLRTTRPGVLDVAKIDTLRPGMHVFPNYIRCPQSPRSYARVLTQLQKHFDLPRGSIQQLEIAARPGVEISADEAAAIVAPLKTGSKNTWRDSTISAVIHKVAEKLDNRVLLRFRTADRKVGQDGFISTGTLSGDELQSARAQQFPTLYIMSVRTTEQSGVGGGQEFMYPTLVIPDRFPNLFMFNRGQ